jgi:hypothetical protein
VLFVAGCVHEEVQGSTIVYTHAWWGVALWVFAGLAVVAFGVCALLATQVGSYVKSRLIPGLFFTAVGIFLLLGTPWILGEHVLVDDDHFEHYNYSFFGVNDNHSIRFDELDSISLKGTIQVSSRSMRTKYSLICTKKNGEIKSVAVGHLVDEATSQILMNARKKGVKVIGFD